MNIADAFWHKTFVWQVITHFGSAGLLLPMLAIALMGLWQAGQRRAVRVWMLSLSFAVVITMTSKLLFMGWGLGIASLDFTGISGHTLLATSILPVLFNVISGKSESQPRYLGVWAGLILSTGVGISRIVLGMHSVSEVVAGWIIGMVVCGVALSALENRAQQPGYLRFSGLILLLAFGSTTSNYLPTHALEIRLALQLSGHDKLFTRP